VDNFLSDTRIAVDPKLQTRAWVEAGFRYARYAGRRRRSTKDTLKRLVADFMIGCHARIHADRLTTLDARRYQRDFPELKLIFVSYPQSNATTSVSEGTQISPNIHPQTLRCHPEERMSAGAPDTRDEGSQLQF
jgi:hypothetical protein